MGCAAVLGAACRRRHRHLSTWLAVVCRLGTVAAPYFSLFNPTTQGEQRDPARDYIRPWVPELAGVDDAHTLKNG
jgi:deoxyribodipyrimidine photolyase